MVGEIFLLSTMLNTLAPPTSHEIRNFSPLPCIPNEYGLFGIDSDTKP